MAALPALPLPQGISERQIDCSATCGLSFHILEAGFSASEHKPLLLLVHGFPELAFSWRKVMVPLAAAGYYVVALDQRGYGRTTGWDASDFDKTDFSQFTMTTLVGDALALVSALGYTSVHCVIGHDFGAVTAALCALVRPDFFERCITMSHPFKGSPTLPLNTANETVKSTSGPKSDVHVDLANLARPRKHYKWYNSTPPAASDWLHPPQGLHKFLRGYLHLKSADWEGNKPHPLKAWSAEELALMPEYYILPLDATMPEAIDRNMRGEDAGRTNRWMSDDELAVFVSEWSRTGFQGGLNWYRTSTDPAKLRDMLLFAGRKIEVPYTFISGESDWGNFQEPGAIEALSRNASKFKGVRLVPGAGHWPQQEQPDKVVEEILRFLREVDD